MDLEAIDINDLLEAVDGQNVMLLDGSEAPLAGVFGAVQVNNDMNAYERVLGIISSRTVSSLLFLAGIAIEFFSPGNVLPGVAGVIALIASFLGVGTLLPGEAEIAFIMRGHRATDTRVHRRSRRSLRDQSGCGARPRSGNRNRAGLD